MSSLTCGVFRVELKLLNSDEESISSSHSPAERERGNINLNVRRVLALLDSELDDILPAEL